VNKNSSWSPASLAGNIEESGNSQVAKERIKKKREKKESAEQFLPFVHDIGAKVTLGRGELPRAGVSGSAACIWDINFSVFR